MTPSELREITEKAKLVQRNKAQEYLDTTGYQLMKAAAEKGCNVVYLEDIPELITLLEGQGFRVGIIAVTGKVYASWNEK